MNKLFDLIGAWKYSLLGFICLLIGIYFFATDSAPSYNNESIQAQFTTLESEQQAYARLILRNVKSNKPITNQSNLVYHLYDKDVLFGWNSNQLPIGRYQSGLFPGNGLIKLNNGWYYCHTLKDGDLTCCVSFCILKDYEFSNAYLRASNPSFWKQKFQVNLDGNGRRKAILNNKKNVVFWASSLPMETAPLGSNWGPFILIIAGLLIIYQIQVNFVQNLWANLFLLLSLVLLRTAVYEIKWPSTWLESDWFSAGFFAFDEWYPDFFSFAVNGFFILFGVRILLSIVRIFKSTWVNSLLVVMPILLWIWIEAQLKIVVNHSDIPLSFEHLFELRLSSYFFFALMGFYLYTFQKTIYVILQLNQQNPRLKHWAWKPAILFIPFVCLLIFDANWMDALPLIVILIHLVFYNTKERSWSKLSSQLLILTVNAAIISLYLQKLQDAKDIENRMLYAQQLAQERNINLELAYAQVAPKISNEMWLHRDFDSLRQQFTKVGFEHVLTQKFFTGIWDGFDIDAELFDQDNQPCFGVDTLKLVRLKKLVKKHSQPSDIQNGIYFMPHEEEGLSYVILLRIDAQRNLALTLVSKRIPEEIGFPRLLISDQAGISSGLEQYAIGKYAEGRLIHQTGTYNYPLKLTNMRVKNKGNTISEFRGFTHVIVSQQPGSAIIISTPNEWFSKITSFAFLFVFWGLLLISHQIFKSISIQKQTQWTLSFKVQIAFLVILGLSLFLYGLGSSLFIGKQFNSYSQQALKDKLDAVQTELSNQTAALDTLDANTIGKQLETKLAKLSSVFKTDLFVFDSDGFLVASSRPKLFAYGLIGEHMNAQAMDALIGRNQSYFSHQDQIGTLTYRSAYLPIMNQNSKQLGYINLQLFGQQEAYELQIENFLKAAINVFVLLLAISVFIALLVSNWLIGPLQSVARSVRAFEFGKNNQKINYYNNDEIGLLVRAYNDKLRELEQAAGQLARSERESAWRDLAQQIAHEIKNPLTPMKLHIQHLLRKIESNDSDLQPLLQSTLPSLIDQIDSMARMANEFARFAKLPEPNFEKIALIPFLEQTIQLFDQNQGLIAFHPNPKNLWIMADKDMLSQVINNLLLNAKQATESVTNPTIELAVKHSTTHLEIQCKDNGIGILESEQERIFTPYFTTKSSGSGIGLSVVRQIVEKHNGKIWFESTPKVGTIFYIEFKRFNEA
jgi:two-component system nitrogen regulation sensor histidine kinase NtrY